MVVYSRTLSENPAEVRSSLGGPAECKGKVVKVTVVSGTRGAVAAAGLALTGHEVLATDIDRVKLDEIRGGRKPFFEPGLSQ